jgi:hypothetical protein
MKIEKVLVTPEIAAKWLANNTQNRNVNQSRINRYVRDMQESKWRDDTGEIIKIAKDGIVLDGQHRLIAVVKSQLSIYFHVGFNMSNDLFQVLDTGKSRSGVDVLKIAGVKNTSAVSSLINSYNQYLNTNSRKGSNGEATNLSGHELLQFYEDRKEWVDNIVHISDGLYSAFQRVWVKGEVLLFLALFTDVDKIKGYDFMRELCQGTDVTSDVIPILRNRLIAEKIHTTKKTKSSVMRALVIKSWNAYYSGKELKSLRFNPDCEEYPKILGLDK